MTVLIGQNDQLQGHEHSVKGGSAANEYTWLSKVNAARKQLVPYYTEGIISDGTNGTPRVGNETRGKNFTVRYWKRIS